MSHASHADLEVLMSHSAWVRRLAERLVADPSQADDLVQETWLAALRHRSGPLRSDRAFLGSVLRRLAWQRLRSEGRRHARERDSARAEATPSTSELVERMSAHRRVVEKVLELPEIYREVLLRRYFEGETPTAIAEHLELPVATVKTRLQRGLARMRSELDEDFGGDGKAWVAGLAPLVRRGARPDVALVSGGPAAYALVAVLLVPLAVLGFLLWRAVRSGGETARPAIVQTSGAEAGAAAASAAAGPSAPAAAREDAAPDRAAAGAGALARDRAFVASQRAIAGRVVGADGAPAPGVLLRFEPRGGGRGPDPPDAGADSEAIALSGAGGRFELRGARGAGDVSVLTRGLVPLAPARVGADEAPRDLVVVVAPARPVAGGVADPSGAPIAGARVELVLEAPLGGLVGAALERAAPYVHAARTDELGGFAFPAAGDVAGLALRARAPGYAPAQRALERGAGGPFDLVLTPAGPAPGGVTGRVLDPGGAPVAGAIVSYGDLAVRTGPDGTFTIEERAARLVAVHEGFGPAFAEPEGGAFPAPLELRLPPAPLELAGTVRDGAGEPLAGVEVWLHDPTLLSIGRASPPPPSAAPSAERSGRSTAGVSTRFSLPADDEVSPVALPRVVEAVLAGRPRRPWTAVHTDRDGRFVLAGLGDRPYRLAVLDPARLEVHVRGPFRPADGPVELTVEPGPRRERLAGRVVDAGGAPVPGVRVRLFRHVQALRHGDTSLLQRMVTGGSTVTDEQGRFRLRDVPHGEVFLDLTGSAIVPRVHALADEAGAGAITVAVDRAALLSLTLLDPSEADAFELLDDAGAVQPLVLRREGLDRTLARAPLVDGRSEVLRVPARASAVRLLRAGVAVREAPVRLDPTGRTDVQL